MDLQITTTPGSDTFATINGERLRIGRDWLPVTADELSDPFARAFREIGADPQLVSADDHGGVWGTAERADGTIDTYHVSIIGGMVRATYGWTITPNGERFAR